MATGGRWWGEKGSGGSVLGALSGGGAGGPSRVRHLTRRREGPGQRRAPGAVAPGRAHGSRGGPGR
jgi:hypothetical protein